MSSYLTDNTLASLPGIRHGFFMRTGGASSGVYDSLNCGPGSNDDRRNVIENRNRVAEALMLEPGSLLTAYQHHSADVIVAEKPWKLDALPKGDAIVTRTPGLLIGILTADCGPVLFADAEARVIGAAHAGWKGAFSGVLKNTVAEMEKLGAKRSRIVAALGPCIRQQSYEVGAEFVQNFLTQDSANKRFFQPQGTEGKALFDLGAYISHHVQSLDINEFNDIEEDTLSQPECFFSYRRTTLRGESDYGRQVSCISLEN